MMFGKILRDLLEENMITQKQLANDLNIAPTTVSNYIRGIREPDFEILKLFAVYFNVTTDYLLDFHAGNTKEHREDQILRSYRLLPKNSKDLFIEQGKLLVRMQIKEKANQNNNLDI